MTDRHLEAVVVFVAAMGLLQIFYEDIIMFFATTQSGPAGVLNSPYVMIGIPLVISSLLILVLVGGPIVRSNTLR